MKSHRCFRLLAPRSPRFASAAFRPGPPPQIIISVPDQRLVVVENGVLVGHYPISTSKFGLGDQPGSYATPLGTLEVAAKVGDGAPVGAVFKSQHLNRGSPSAQCPRPRPDRHPHPPSARSRCRQLPRLRPRHLHSRHPRGIEDRSPGQLRLHPHALGRCHPRVRRRSRGHEDRNREHIPAPGHGRIWAVQHMNPGHRVAAN